MDLIYDFPRKVIDVVQEGLPYYDFINPQIMRLGKELGENGTLSDVVSPVTLFSEVLLWLTPTVVVVFLLAILCIGLYFAACCYPCCRAKGHCCAHGNQHLKHYHNCKFSVCMGINFLFIIGLLLGVGIGLAANSRASSSIRNLPDSFLSALEDGFDYVNDTVTETLFAVTDQRDMAIASANSDLQNIDTELVDPVLNTLDPLFNTVVQNSTDLLDNLESSMGEVAAINATIEDLYNQLAQLNSSLSSLKSHFETFFANCNNNTACERAVPTVPSINAISGLIDTVETTNILRDVGINATREHLKNTTRILNNITTQISDEASTFNISSNDTLLSFVRSVEDFRDTVNRDNENGAFTSISKSLNTTDMFIDSYEVYRFAAGVVLNGLFIAIAVTFLIGTTVGVVGFRNQRDPKFRTRLSHCGGTAIYGGIAASFLLSGVLLFSSIPPYFVGTLLQKTCNDLAPPQYVLLATTVDNTSLFDGSTLIGSLLTDPLNETTLRANISGALKACENNEPLFQALQLDESFNITEFLLRQAEISEEDMIDMLDFQYVADTTLDEVLPEATRRSIEDVPRSLDAGQTDSLNQNVLDVSVETLDANLTDLANFFMLMGMPTEADMVIMVRNDLVRDQINRSIIAIESKKAELKADLREVNNSLQNTMVQANDLLALLYIFHNETATVLRMELLEFVRQMSGYFTAYSRYLANAIKNEIGRCQSVPEAYRTIYLSVCTDFLDAINGTWLGVIWCVSALIALIITGTSLAAFLRRGSEHFDDTLTSYTYRSSGTYPTLPHFPAPTSVFPSDQQLYPSAPPYALVSSHHSRQPPPLPAHVTPQSPFTPRFAPPGLLPPTGQLVRVFSSPQVQISPPGHRNTKLFASLPYGLYQILSRSPLDLCLPEPFRNQLTASSSMRTLSVPQIQKQTGGGKLKRRRSSSLPLLLSLQVHLKKPVTTLASNKVLTDQPLSMPDSTKVQHHSKFLRPMLDSESSSSSSSSESSSGSSSGPLTVQPLIPKPLTSEPQTTEGPPTDIQILSTDVPPTDIHTGTPPTPPKDVLQAPPTDIQIPFTDIPPTDIQTPDTGAPPTHVFQAPPTDINIPSTDVPPTDIHTGTPPTPPKDVLQAPPTDIQIPFTDVPPTDIQTPDTGTPPTPPMDILQASPTDIQIPFTDVPPTDIQTLEDTGTPPTLPTDILQAPPTDIQFPSTDVPPTDIQTPDTGTPPTLPTDVLQAPPTDIQTLEDTGTPPTPPMDVLQAPPTDIQFPSIDVPPTDIQTPDTGTPPTLPTDVLQAPPTDIQTLEDTSTPPTPPMDVLQAPPTDMQILSTDVPPTDIQTPDTGTPPTLPTDVLQAPPTYIQFPSTDVLPTDIQTLEEDTGTPPTLPTDVLEAPPTDIQFPSTDVPPTDIQTLEDTGTDIQTLEDTGTPPTPPTDVLQAPFTDMQILSTDIPPTDIHTPDTGTPPTLPADILQTPPTDIQIPSTETPPSDFQTPPTGTPPTDLPMDIPPTDIQTLLTDILQASPDIQTLPTDIIQAPPTDIQTPPIDIIEAPLTNTPATDIRTFPDKEGAQPSTDVEASLTDRSEEGERGKGERVKKRREKGVEGKDRGGSKKGRSGREGERVRKPPTDTQTPPADTTETPSTDVIQAPTDVEALLTDTSEDGVEEEGRGKSERGKSEKKKRRGGRSERERRERGEVGEKGVEGKERGGRNHPLTLRPLRPHPLTSSRALWTWRPHLLTRVRKEWRAGKVRAKGRKGKGE